MQSVSVRERALGVAAAASGGALMLWEILLTRVFSVVLFADLAHLALATAMLGIALGALAVARRPTPPADLPRLLRGLLLAQGAATVLTIAAALWLPLTRDDASLMSWYERDRVHLDLLHLPAFTLLLLLLPLPAVASGALMATLFRHPPRVARVYAADLGAAALAALLFIPLSQQIAPPDLAFLAAAACVGGGLPLSPGRGARRGLVLLLVGCGAVLCFSGMNGPVLTLRRAAGWSEQHVVTSIWTPLARLAIFSGPSGVRGVSGDYLLLDNGSASLIVTQPAQVKELESFVSRGLVHALHPPGARVAILAAGAGPEAAVALHHGHTDILAVDLDAVMFQMVRDHAPEAPNNPLLHPGVRTLARDARAALRQEPEPFDIIQLVHANLVTATGLLHSAWSPRLLYTREAINLYLDHLDPEGTLSLTAPEQAEVLRTAQAALATRGAAAPADHIVAIATARRDQVLLIKPRPFRVDERATIDAWMAQHGLRALAPATDPTAAGGEEGVLTDDRPYPDRLATLWRPGSVLPVVYRAMIWALGVLVGVLGLVVGLGARQAPHSGRPLLFAGCLGYGYLAIEIILIHRLVPLVGHPTYALVTVLVAMLAGSGLGSALAARRSPADLGVVLAGIVLLGAGSAGLLPGAGEGLPDRLGLRALGLGLALLPLSILAGGAMPLALRAVGERQPHLPALMWAVNGWASVLAATAALLTARLGGYTVALAVALLAYALAGGLWWWGGRRSLLPEELDPSLTRGAAPRREDPPPPRLGR